ncbi:MAG: hypothetical protein Q8L78_00230 [Coxiellaceae bacterium]|nr:hypothetical protein [Coxiellaceae bacterium]
MTSMFVSTKTTYKLDQNTLINRFIAYMAIKNPDKPPSRLWQEKLKIGLCEGFAILYAYMAAIDKLTWWEALLNCISQWDEKEISLQKIITLPNENAQKPLNEKKLDYYFKQAINFVLFHQAIWWQNGIQKLNQNNLFSPDQKWFDPPEGKILLDKQFIENTLTVEKLERILNAALFSTKNILLLFSFYFKKMGFIPAGHCCALRYNIHTKKWCCYDPAIPQGEESFPDIATLYYVMTSRYSTNTDIEIISFNTHFYFDNAFYEHTSSKEEKLTSLQQQLQYLQKHYQNKLDESDSKGFNNGFFGKYFSAGTRLSATKRLLSTVHSLQSNPSATFDITHFGPAERNGKLGVILEKLKAIYISKEPSANTDNCNGNHTRTNY